MPDATEVVERKTAVIDASLIRDAKMIAAHDETTVSEVLERLLRPQLTKEVKRITASLAEIGEAGA